MNQDCVSMNETAGDERPEIVETALKRNVILKVSYFMFKINLRIMINDFGFMI